MIALLPLDDRPCNWLFPQQLAPIAGCELAVPPRELLGSFDAPGDCDAAAGWLESRDASRLIVSLDMLCYGGLVASRTRATDVDEARARLGRLRGLKERGRDLTIFAFATITRLGRTVDSPESLRIHSDLVAYSVLADRVERLGEEAARGEMEEAAARLGEEVVEEYLEVRRRNHAVTREAVRLAAEGVVDYLLICQEDAAPAGLHVGEQAVLREDIARLGLEDRVALHPGADEAGLVLLARHLSELAGRRPRLAVDYASEAGAAAVPRYEHQPLRQTVESQLRAAGAELTTPGRADAILFVHTPIGPQGEAAEAPPEGECPSHALQAESVVGRVEAARGGGYLVGVADAAYANGADPELIAALRRANAVRHVQAFAGWNTAANTVGTAAAQLCLQALSSGAAEPDSEASARFLACRLLDDWAYQSRVRRRAMELAEAEGANPYRLGRDAGRFESYVQGELEPFAHEIHSFGVQAGDGSRFSFSTRLPWGRLFEAEVECVSSSQ